MLGSEYATSGIERFCNELLAARSAAPVAGSELPSIASSGEMESLGLENDQVDSHAQVQ